MPIKHRVEITAARDRECFAGLAAASRMVARLKAQKSTLPGFGLALAIAEREMADWQIDWSGVALRIASKAGHPIHDSLAVYATGDKSGPYIEVEFPDLADDAGSQEA